MIESIKLGFGVFLGKALFDVAILLVFVFVLFFAFLSAMAYYVIKDIIGYRKNKKNWNVHENT